MELPRLLTDKRFREGLLDNIDDPELVSVFHDRMDRWGREEPLILESILNKVSALTLNPILRTILGQRENKLNFRKIMDEGMVLIADLGRCDSETRRLLGSLIVTTLEQAAIGRKDEPLRNRRPFYFYIDEFQDFCANEASSMTLSHILSEARKFGLSLSLAHQTLGQMTSERMQSALGNMGTKVIFAIDRYDAEVMAKKLFTVEIEKIKHEVEDVKQQDRTHPIFYSLQEGWEEAVQAIQELKPRTCLVKAPYRRVVKLHTMAVPERRETEHQLDSLLRGLLERNGSPYPTVQSEGTVTDDGSKVEYLGYYEPAEPLDRPEGRRLRITSWPEARGEAASIGFLIDRTRPNRTAVPRRRRGRK